MSFYGAPAGAGRLIELLINLELRAHHLEAAAAELYDGAQIQTYLVRGAFGTDPKRIKSLGDSIAEKIGAEAVVIQQTAGGLLVMVPKSDEFRRDLAPAEIRAALARAGRRRPRSAVPLGIDATGDLAWLDFTDPRSPHLGVVGVTGSGKTTLLNWIALRLALQNSADRVGLIMVSPKIADLQFWRGADHLLHPPISAMAEAAKVLGWLVAELETRAAFGVNAPAIVAVIDEVPDLVAVDSRIAEMLARVAAVGRAAGIHLLIGSQMADRGTVGALIYNCAVRAVGKVAAASLAYITSGRAGSEADRLLGRGDFLLTGGLGLRRFQAPVISGREWGLLPRSGAERRLELQDLPASEAPPAERRGGWNRTDLDQDQIEEIAEAIRDGASVRQIMAEYGIGFTRAQKIRDSILEGE